MRDLVAQIEERMIRERIKQARKEAGLTQQQLAELIEVIPRSVQNYEDVEAGRVPWGKMNQIAAAVGKPPEWLIHGDPSVVAGPVNVNGLDQRVATMEGQLTELIGLVRALTAEVASQAAPDEPTSPARPSRRSPRATGRDSS